MSNSKVVGEGIVEDSERGGGVEGGEGRVERVGKVQNVAT